jgi:hypothetical protein
MIMGSGQVWVLSALRILRPTAALGHAGFAGRTCKRGSWAGVGRVLGGWAGRPVGPPAGFGPLG